MGVEGGRLTPTAATRTSGFRAARRARWRGFMLTSLPWNNHSKGASQLYRLTSHTQKVIRDDLTLSRMTSFDMI